MDNLSVIVPFRNGHATIERLLGSLPAELPVIIVDDVSDIPLGDVSRGKVVHSGKRGYFTGAVNLGLSQCATDVLILNQDVYFAGDDWLKVIDGSRMRYGLIGESITGLHPAWPLGYIQGTFMFIRRDVINKIGPMNAELYPLWGSTCEYQLRAARAGFEVLPLKQVPGFQHRPGHKARFGSSIEQTLKDEPERQGEFIRTPPEISVVIPCYNYGHYLPDAVGSLMEQTFQSFEVIIVNDASTDNSLQIAQSLADPWKGIRVVHLSNNVGTAAALNAGIKQTYGKYIAVLSADDMMRPYRLADFYRLQLENPHSFIYDDLILFGTETDKLAGTKKAGKDVIFPLPPYDFEKLIHKNGVHAGIMYPRQAWVETGGYPGEMGKGREDWAFNVALGIKGYCGVKAERPSYLYRREGQNRTLINTRWTSHQYFKEQMVRLYPDIYRGVRPMGCCGGKKGNFTINGSKTLMAQQASLPGRDGFEVLEYIGNSAGTMTWWGPVTRTRYVFGGSRRVGYVDARDAAGMLRIADQGQQAFRIYRKPVVKPAPVVEVVAAAKPVAAVEPIATAVAVAEEAKPEAVIETEVVKTLPKSQGVKKTSRRKK